MNRIARRLSIMAGLVAVMAAVLAAQARQADPPAADGPERIDYLTFAQGAVPVSIGGAGAKLGANFEAAVRIADGDPTAFTIVSVWRLRANRIQLVRRGPVV